MTLGPLLSREEFEHAVDENLIATLLDHYEAREQQVAALTEEQEIGRRRNRWLEDEVRRLADLVQSLGVQRDAAESRVAVLTEQAETWRRKAKEEVRYRIADSKHIEAERAQHGVVVADLKSRVAALVAAGDKAHNHMMTVATRFWRTGDKIDAAIIEETAGDLWAALRAMEEK